jgi:hypothetical protein
LNHFEKILDYHWSLDQSLAKYRLPRGVDWLYPYTSPKIRDLMQFFYQLHYNDTNPRYILFGINPGRFGAGITGIPFTDPTILKLKFGLDTDLPLKKELSSEFIYNMINSFGGIQHFYSTFYFSSLCPLGFVKKGVNFNYYDAPLLQKRVSPFIIDNIRHQIQLVDAPRDMAFCLGEGKNFQFFSSLNEKHQFFQKIVPLPHPRWIMQYRRIYVMKYIELYINRLNQSAT